MSIPGEAVIKPINPNRMNIFLITQANIVGGYSIATFCLLFGIAISVWAIRTAKCYDHEDDPVDLEPVTYDEIIMREHFSADILNN